MKQLSKATSREQLGETIYGLPHNQPTSYFVGCGWSYWLSGEFHCLSGALDDKVFFLEDTFSLEDLSHDVESDDVTKSEIKVEGGNVERVHEVKNNGDADRINGRLYEQRQSSSLPLCTLQDELPVNHQGRWVREQFPNATQCPQPMEYDQNFSKKTDIIKHDSNHPHCWLREDLTRKSAFKHFNFPEDSVWKSSLHLEKEWFGSWKHDHCEYLEFTDSDLQKCVNQKKIAEVNVRGRSVAEYLQMYVGLRLQNIQLYDGSKGDGISILLTSLALPHYCSEGEEKPSLQKFFNQNKLQYGDEKFRLLLDQFYPNRTTISDNQELYFINGLFHSSERTLMCTAPKVEHLGQIAEEVLVPRGYNLINTYDMSAAFTYDSAAANDGLHIKGPPMKMIVTKFFHHFCT